MTDKIIKVNIPITTQHGGREMFYVERNQVLRLYRVIQGESRYEGGY
jgi:hypothetical protein